jgi:hypothetical protein
MPPNKQKKEREGWVKVERRGGIHASSLFTHISIYPTLLAIANLINAPKKVAS